ncbi:MAG: hydrolase 1, exosortase A system-associated [Sphingomonadales bacterium]|nr:hydrolase 1, exosortase A system-associated [Sphingomonadales bacterium]
MRDFLTLACAGDTIAATIDRPDGEIRAGLLIVSGGNELRSGAHRGMAMLAQRFAAQGIAVLRFDRRGVGDSGGDNAGFDASGPDIATALAQLRAACPPESRIAAFGNCDAASALALHGPFVGIDAFVLANPWAIEEARSETGSDDATPLPSAAAIRARYRAKLKDPREWMRLLRGGVDLTKLARGLSRARGGDAPSALADRLGEAMAKVAVPTQILLASRDRTAIEFIAAWTSPAFAAARGNKSLSLHDLDSASHSFARDADKAWLEERLLAALNIERPQP